MQIVEVKNNLVKISYDTSAINLILSGFVVIKDSAQSFIGQVANLEANSKGNFAIVKLLFNFDDEGVITNFNGSIPSLDSALDVVRPSELLELLPVQNPIVIGELAQQKTQLNVDRKLVEQKLVICSEKAEDNQILTQNLASQLVYGGKKVLVLDTEGSLDFSDNKIVAGSDFKLPLNYETINFIYEKGLDDAKAETKAMIQEIFLEVQDYVKSLPEKFIPFETFKTVVDEQYEEMELVELVLLKNKLLKYYEAGIFAQEQSEFASLKSALESNNLTVFDLSGVDEKIQREMISYAYSLISEYGEEVYVFCNVNNANSDKKLLKQIFSTQNAYSTLICSYAFKYLKELKQLAKDLILFAPLQQQMDFAGYNVFLEKLNPQEFIIYGHATHHLPLIVKLEPISVEFADVSADAGATQEISVDEQIIRDVDEIFVAPKVEVAVEDDDEDAFIEDDLTEDDLDLIDDLNFVDNNAFEEIIEDEAQENEGFISSEDELEDIIIPEAIEAQEQAQVSGEDTLTALFGEIPENEIVEEKPFVFSETEAAENKAEDTDNEEEPQASFKEVFIQQEEQEKVSDTPALDILPIKMASTPIVPIYSADIAGKNEAEEFAQGDAVSHPKYGKGTVEKLITYGTKTLCSIHFDNVGRRLLDPSLAEIKKA